MASCWEWLGCLLGERPIQILFLTIGAMVVAGALGYSIATSHENRDNINQIKAAFCNAPNKADNVKQCHQLLDRLLANPTPAQVKRLRQIIKEEK